MYRSIIVWVIACVDEVVDVDAAVISLCGAMDKRDGCAALHVGAALQFNKGTLQHLGRHEGEGCLPCHFLLGGKNILAEFLFEYFHQGFSHERIVLGHDAKTNVHDANLSQLFLDEFQVGTQHVNGHVQHFREALGKGKELFVLEQFFFGDIALSPRKDSPSTGSKFEHAIVNRGQERESEKSHSVVEIEAKQHMKERTF